MRRTIRFIETSGISDNILPIVILGSARVASLLAPPVDDDFAEASANRQGMSPATQTYLSQERVSPGQLLLEASTSTGFSL